jgi:sulfite reductase beta subunit-like hemoprotein
MGLGRAVREALQGRPDLLGDPLIERLHIRVSGCPNGCGQHHVADIGLHGGAIKGERGLQVPSYDVFLGGRHEGGDVRYGTRLGIKVPAKAVPGLVCALLAFYRDRRQPDESFSAFVDRVGRQAFEEVAAPLAPVPNFAEKPEFYYDWERSNIYRVERGEGECAA